MTIRSVGMSVIAAIAAGFFSSPAHAADYPVPGQMTPEYHTLFRLIDRGRCEDMSPLVSLLEKRTGSTLTIYEGICLVNANRLPEAYRLINKLIESQEYDEADYLLDYIGERGINEPIHLKYRGVVAYNIGDLEESVEYLQRYLSMKADREVTFTLADMFINRNDLAEATALLDTLPLDDDKKRYRQGVVAMKQGSLRKAYRLLRSVSRQNVSDTVYAQAQIYIAEMCYSERRMDCAIEKYEDVLDLGLDAFTEASQDRIDLIKDDRVAMSGMFILGLQYDTNVTAAPEDIDNVSDESSLRTYGVLDVSLNLFTGLYDHLEVGVFNYGAKNRDVEGYDMHNHVLYFRGTWKEDSHSLTFPEIRHGVTYFNDDLFLSRTDLGASVTLRRSRGIIEFPALLTLKEFNDDLSGSLDRDSVSASLGVRGVRRFGTGHRFTMSGFVTEESAEGTPQSNHKYDAAIRLNFRLSPTFGLRYFTDGTFTDYYEVSREDLHSDTGIFLDIKPLDRITIRVGGRYVTNDSDINFYDYKKSIFDFSLSTYF